MVRSALRGNLPKAGEAYDPDALMQRLWFSDGGISSNFPVHFFGHWMPQRPTFGIDLTEMPDAAFTTPPQSPNPTDSSPPPIRGMHLDGRYTSGTGTSDAVVLPLANRALHPEWSPIASLAEFLGSIWETSHSFRDNMLMQLPAFRDRVVRVR